MFSTSDLFFLICAFIVIANFDHVASDGKGGIVIMEGKHHLGKQNDLIMWGTGCGHGVIKDGGKKGKSILVLPGPCKQVKKVIKKKVEYVPMPVKEYVTVKVPEYIPVPIKQEPILIPVKMDMGHSGGGGDGGMGGYGMSGDMGGGYGY